MNWTCPYCKDDMDEKFRASHERVCAVIRDYWQAMLDNRLAATDNDLTRVFHL